MDEISGLLGHTGEHRITAGYAKYDPNHLPHAKQQLSAIWQEVCASAKEWHESVSCQSAWTTDFSCAKAGKCVGFLRLLGWWAVTGSNRRPSRCKREEIAPVDSDSDSDEPRTNAEQSETGGDFRVSYESDKRLHYSEHQVQLRPDYSGPLERCSPDEVRALFCEMLERTEVCSVWDWPLPPAGLPGYVGYGYTRDAPEAQLIELGIRYVQAIVKNERKAMHNRWADAADFIYKIEKNTGERIQRKLAERQVRAAMAEARKRAASNRVRWHRRLRPGPGAHGRVQDRRVLRDRPFLPARAG
jgi:hypothetical protein